MAAKGQRLADMNLSDLAEHVIRNARTPGQTYATLRRRPEKEAARARVLGLFTRMLWPKGLSILTMPGLRWNFERQLLDMREGRKYVDCGRSRRTFITAIEQDEAVYRASLKWIPNGQNLQAREALPCSTAAIRTGVIGRYHRCAFEDYAFVEQPPLDAAWLDFNGPLTERRLAAIQAFWRKRIRHYLIVTVGVARQSREISQAMVTAGGVPGLLSGLTPGGEVTQVLGYSDTTPMVQVVIAREGPGE